MNILYTASATASGGRTGKARSSDGILDLALVTPKELGGAGGEGTNPEQLFAAGYAACFIGALKFVAGQKKIAIGEPEVTVQVGIGPRDDGAGFGLSIALRAAIPAVDAETAQGLIDAAHIVCPYSELTRNGAPVDLALA